MADPSLLMNNELPVNGIGFPMPSAGMAFSNGPDMQGKVLPQASPYGYPMFGVGAPGDMAGAHMPGVNQMAQGNDSNNWMGGMGQQAMGMGQSVPPFMMGGQSFQNPSPYGMPPNASSSMPPSSQMNSMPFAGGSYGGFSSWPSGQPSGTDQNWMNSQSGSQPSAMKPPVPGMDASSASTPAVGDITSQSLPELGDVGIAAEDKTRNGNSRELVNGDAAANAAPQQQQQPQQQSRHAQQQQPGSNVFNTMMSSSSVGASPSADASGSKLMPNHPLFGQDGTVNSSAGAMLPAFASGMQPATVAVTTQQAAGPMHSNFPRHPMAMAHSVSGNQMMSQGMMYPNHMFPRMPMDSMMMQQSSGAPPFSSPVVGGMAAPAAGQTTPAPQTPVPAPSSEAGSASGSSRCPKNISEVLQPLYKLGDEPGRKPMLDRLVQLSEETGTPTLYVPTLASDHTHVDLYRLYEVIKDLGGLVAVVRKKVWRRVIENMGLASPSNVSALASTLRTHYTKLLLPLECKENGKKLAEEMERVEVLRRKRASQRGEAATRNSTASPMSRRSGSPDTSEQPRPPSALADSNSQHKSAASAVSESPSSQSTAKSSVTTTSNLVTTQSSSSALAGAPDSSNIVGMGSVQQQPSLPTTPSLWPNQNSGMQPPSFPANSFPPADPLLSSMPSGIGDSRNQLGRLLPDTGMPAPTDPFLNFPHPQAPPGMMPPQGDGSFSDPRLLQLRNAQFQQWRQQQLLMQQQQQQQQQLSQPPPSMQTHPELQRGSVTSDRGTSSVSSLNAALPTPMATVSQAPQLPTHSQVDGTAVATTAPESPAVLTSHTSQSQVSAATSQSTASTAHAPFSRLLSGGSLESVVQELTSLQTTAASSSPAPPSAPQQKSASTTDLSTIEHATALSVKRKRFSAQHVAQRLGNVPNLWRLHMCLKAGLQAESAQAMNILSVIVNDEHTLCFFQLAQQPTVLETLLAHLAASLHTIFGGFDDISLISDGDAMRRFFPEDLTNKDVAKLRDDEYESVSSKVKREEEDTPMDCASPLPSGDAASDAGLLSCKEESLPDGLRHICTHIGDLERPERVYPPCSESEETSAEVTCSADEIAEREAHPAAEKLCAPWLRHGTAVESEPTALTNRTSEQRMVMLRALCASNLVRSLSFLPANERHMSRHFGLMTVIARVSHLFQGEAENSAKRKHAISTAWWWPALELIRADLLVTFVNISGQVDLSCLPSKLVSLLLQGLCHWCVSSSSSARDPLAPASSCPGLSLQRLALEALSKISIGLGNVSRMVAAVPEESWQCLCGRLVQWLLQKRQSVQYELSLVLLCGLASCDAVSRHICQQHHCVVTLMMQLLSETESFLCTYSNAGVVPEGHNMPSVDLVRRAANLLLVLSRQRCNRRHFAHYQSHLLILAASPFLEKSIHVVLVDLLFQLGLE